MQPLFRQVGRHQVGRLEEGGVPIPLEWLVILGAKKVMLPEEHPEVGRLLFSRVHWRLLWSIELH